MEVAPPDRALLTTMRTALLEVGDPRVAPGQQAYMKSAMPYLGVPAPERRRVCRQAFAECSFPSADSWRRTVLALWRGARFREERYAAIALTGHRAYRDHQTPDALAIYDEMIVTGAWWDYVDDVAIHRVGPLLSAHRDAIRPVMLARSTDADREWLLSQMPRVPIGERPIASWGTTAAPGLTSHHRPLMSIRQDVKPIAPATSGCCVAA